MRKLEDFFHSLDISAVLTVLGIILLFSGAILVTLIAPSYIDPTWTTPSSAYQVQMYEDADPHFYISSAGTQGQDLHYVYHLQKGRSLLAFKESETVKIEANKELERYITRANEPLLKLTSRLLLLREREVGVFELYEPLKEEAFAAANSDEILGQWVDRSFTVIDPPVISRPLEEGSLYILNPKEFLVVFIPINGKPAWQYSPKGKSVDSLAELTSPPLAFTSRQTLIAEGEHIYAIEGCWYCHTDQTRTLVQDLVLNGSESYPAPPSTPNEYIYQQITFPGTKRNGPDLSRVGVKKASRDWHKAHFWSPKTASEGSIMPSFKHFFDYDPRGTSPIKPGVPNRKFEAIFQYLMTKGTRITSPDEAWWKGKDRIKTKEIIESRR
jgi:cytochrome c oxidase cbb3-type subunit 2